jgi:1-acyl-sn-glycerol-3-phosphate acyltransferase
LRRAFDGVYVSGLAEARRVVDGGPVIFAANHVSWWDAFAVVLLDRALGATSHCLMEAQNLARLPFFGWIGAVPIHRDDPRAAVADLRAAARLLAGPGDALWIFPQGRHRPAHLRPLGFERGVSLLAKMSGRPVVPVSITYGFRERPEMTLAIAFGAPLAAEEARSTETLELRVAAGLDRNDAFLVSGAGAYTALVDGRSRSGVPLAGRLLARFGGARA